MKNSSDSSGKSGNTKQISPASNWCFTLNNYTDEDIKILNSSIDPRIKAWVFQEETGENGTPHLQGYMNFGKDKVRPMSIFSYTKRISWSATRNIKNAIAYCCKEDTRTGKIYFHGLELPKPELPDLEPEVLDRKDFYPFQESLAKILEGPINKNKVIWVYDKKGQNGKSDFMRWANKEWGYPFTYGGNCNDIINLVYNSKSWIVKQERPCLIYNLTRMEDPRYISYKSMEEVSDGNISNSKFECGCFLIPRKPHVLVLANTLPLDGGMTKGRFIIYTITKDKELIKYENDLKE